MAWTGFYRHTNGTDTLYAMPLATGAFTAVGVVTGSDTDQTTLYVFASLDDALTYEIRIRAGAEPVVGDLGISVIGNVPTATEISDRIERAGGPLDKLEGTLEDDGASGWQFTELALENGPGGAGSTAKLDAIKAKTDLITSQSASQTRTPLSVIRIIRNDSHLQAIAVATDYTGYTATFTIRHRVTNAVLCQVSSVDVTSSTVLTVSLSTADTAFALLVDPSEFGPHPFDIQLVSGQTTRTEEGVAVIVRDQTT